MRGNNFLGYNLLITIFTILSIIIALIGTFNYELPDIDEIKTVTGIISKYNQKDQQWYDAFFDAGGTNSYFNVRLSDNSFYEATGICYDNMDRSLYDVITVGEEITIRYIDNGGDRTK